MMGIEEYEEWNFILNVFFLYLPKYNKGQTDKDIEEDDGERESSLQEEKVFKSFQLNIFEVHQQFNSIEAHTKQ